jgi:O-antigen ligase/tetratricopeptide (TPR) repeat protein
MILTSVVAFTVVLGLVTWNAEDPSRSFWSNFERMEGYVTILHLFCFFIVTTSVFRTKKAWYALLNTSLVFSVILGLRAFADYDMSRDGAFVLKTMKGVKYFFGSLFGTPPETVRIAGPLGNSSYLGVYSLLHAFIGGLVFTTLRGVKTFKDAPARYIAYVLAIAFNIVVLYNTGTRGSFVGLVAGVFVTVLIPLLLLFFGNSKFKESISEKTKDVIKKVSITSLVIIVVAVAFLGMNKESDFIKKSNLLSRFSSLITFDVQGVLETQGKSRMLLWGMSWKGVQERPLLGWGQDNFPYVFAKYYDPKMYAQEQWFDRTHNVFFDWLIAGGILGLLSYLALFFALLFVLWKKTVLNKENSTYDILEKSIVTGLLTAYFVHNLFIFDNLASYILFFILLAYVHQQGVVPDAPIAEKKKIADATNNLPVNIGIVLLAVLAFGYVSNQAVYKPYMAGKTLIKALQYSQPEAAKYFGEAATTPKAILGLFKEALAYDTFANTEIRERLAENTPALLNGSSDTELITEFTSLVATEYQRAILETPKDPRPLLFFGLYLQKFGLYKESGEYIDRAIVLSPTKQSFLYQKGIVEISTSQFPQAVETFKKAYDLEPSSKESKLLYSLALIYTNKFVDAKKLLEGDIDTLTDERLINILLEKKMYNEIVEIAQLKIASDPTNPQSHMSLAALYLKMGRKADAITEIRKVIELAPDFKDTGDHYIKEIQAGRDPSAQETN